jgi:hypothetical protein
LQVGREKLENVQVEFKQINIVTWKVEEKVATKAVDKMKLVKYNNSLGKGTLKAIRTMEQVIQPSNLKSQLVWDWNHALFVATGTFMWILKQHLVAICTILTASACTCKNQPLVKNVGNSCTPFGLIAKALSAWRRRSTRSKRWHWEWMLRWRCG